MNTDHEIGDELYVAGGGLTNVRPTDPSGLVQKMRIRT